jgi:long-chain acyl-CoA synthetase
MFLHRVAQSPSGAAFSHPTASGWRELTWKEVGDRVRAIACGLRALGLQPEQRAAILASTRLDWILADFGILCAGGATTTIYPSNTPEECAYILKDSETVICFAENEDQVKKLVAKKDELAHLSKVVVFDGTAGHDGWVITLAELEELGKKTDAADSAKYQAVIGAITPQNLATLIYTSGTTGQPKGVELTHDCWIYEAEGIDSLRLMTPGDRQFLWLPLSHSFGKVLLAAQVRIGFFTAVDGRIDKIVENLGQVKPTLVCAVPRIFEKVHNKVVAGAKEGGGLKATIFKWAFDVGKEVSRLRQEGREPSGLTAIKYAVADRLVFSKLKERFGGRLRYFVSGSAPLARELAEFFHAAGILILEGYGLTETSAATFVNRPDRFKFGTVGMPLPGTEVKIAAEDGEILVKGRGLMRGYHRLEEATKETIDGDGWLHTGDIGHLENGLLKITDRKKDLIKTSGGKYVAPQALEGKFKHLCPFVSQVLVHGNNRNFCVALLSLDEESVKKWAGQNGLGSLGYSDLAANDQVKKLIQPYFDQLNAELPSYETIKKFALLPKDLTVEAGELTASLKVKRKVVETKYKALLDGFYEESMVRM